MNFIANEGLECILENFPLFINISLTLCHNKEEKISLESLDLLKKGISFLIHYIENLYEISKNEEKNMFTLHISNKISQIESLEDILNSSLPYFYKSCYFY